LYRSRDHNGVAIAHGTTRSNAPMSTKASVDASGLWLVLARCHRALSQIAEHSIEEAGLCLTDFAALEALLHKGPLTITEIQGKVLLASGSMTAAVDRLEKKEMIIRRPAANDRRAKVLELTPEGKRVIETASRRHATELESAMVVLSQAEKRHLYALLKRLGVFALAAGMEGTSSRMNPSDNRLAELRREAGPGDGES
jgi:MarR family 2-MHQ and catechol resistance regulon transcriptional repressor